MFLSNNVNNPGAISFTGVGSGEGTDLGISSGVGGLSLLFTYNNLNLSTKSGSKTKLEYGLIIFSFPELI
jgi:hypothetical protein